MEYNFIVIRDCYLDGERLTRGNILQGNKDQFKTNQNIKSLGKQQEECKTRREILLKTLAKMRPQLTEKKLRNCGDNFIAAIVANDLDEETKGKNDVVEWHNIYSRKSLFLPPDREPGNKDDYVCKGNWIQNALISDDEKDENTGENLKISNEDGQKERAKQTIRSFGYNYVGVDTLQRINIAVWTLKHLENEIDSFMEWYRKKLRRIGLEDIKKDRFKMGDKIK